MGVLGPSQRNQLIHAELRFTSMIIASDGDRYLARLNEGQILIRQQLKEPGALGSRVLD